MRISYSTEQLPDAKNQVRLSPDKFDEFGMAHPEIHYSIDEYTKRSLAYAHSVAQGIFERIKGAEGVMPPQPDFDYNGAGHIMGRAGWGTTRRAQWWTATGERTII